MEDGTTQLRSRPVLETVRLFVRVDSNRPAALPAGRMPQLPAGISGPGERICYPPVQLQGPASAAPAPPLHSRLPPPPPSC
jgi:hypothetical protein